MDVSIDSGENPKPKRGNNEENEKNKDGDVLERPVAIVVGDLKVLRRVGVMGIVVRWVVNGGIREERRRRRRGIGEKGLRGG